MDAHGWSGYGYFFLTIPGKIHSPYPAICKTSAAATPRSESEDNEVMNPLLRWPEQNSPRGCDKGWDGNQKIETECAKEVSTSWNFGWNSGEAFIVGLLYGYYRGRDWGLSRENHLIWCFLVMFIPLFFWHSSSPVRVSRFSPRCRSFSFVFFFSVSSSAYSSFVSSFQLIRNCCHEWIRHIRRGQDAVFRAPEPEDMPDGMPEKCQNIYWQCLTLSDMSLLTCMNMYVCIYI